MQQKKQCIYRQKNKQTWKNRRYSMHILYLNDCYHMYLLHNFREHEINLKHMNTMFYNYKLQMTD